MEKLCFVQIGRGLFIVFLIAGGYMFIKETIIYWYPLLIAGGLTLLCHPIAHFLVEKLMLKRILASIIVVSFIFMVLLTLIYWLTFELVKSMTQLIPLISEHFEKLLLTAKSFYEQHFWHLYKNYLTSNQQEMIEQQLQQMIGQLGNISVDFFQNILFKMMKLLSIFPYSLMILLFILLATILMTNDWPNIKDQFNQIIPKAINETREEVSRHFKTLLLNYIQAQLLIALITAIILWIGLSFIKVDHAFTIVIVTMIIDLLPVIGTGIIFLPWILYLFVIGQFPLMIKLALLYGFIIIVRQMIEPKIVSARIGIRPLTVLISLFLSLQFLGAIGIILAPLIIIFIHALYQAKVHLKVWQFIKG